jgi:hypothetical protein
MKLRFDSEFIEGDGYFYYAEWVGRGTRIIGYYKDTGDLLIWAVRQFEYLLKNRYLKFTPNYEHSILLVLSGLIL